MPSPKYKLIRRKRSPFYILRLREPCEAGWQEKSTKQTRRREAQQVAAQIVAELDQTGPRRRTWSTFRATYEREHLPRLSSPGVFKSAANKLEQIQPPVYLDELNAPFFKRFRHKLERAGYSTATVASYLKHLRAALGWAEEAGLINHAPRVRTGGTATRRGRAITLEEFERMLAAVPIALKSHQVHQVERLLRGLWLTGLRLSEALAMDWNDENRIRPLRLDTSRPLLEYPAKAHKARRDALVPLAPDAAEFLRQTPPQARQGRVFPLDGPRQPITSADRASRLISRVGAEALIVTRRDSETGATQYATAHDLRRSFATRYAKILPPDLLRELMRHRSIETTRAHYTEPDADHLADQLRDALGP